MPYKAMHFVNGLAWVHQFGLGTPSSVRVAKYALVKKGLIVRNGDAWVVDDMFLGLWLKTTFRYFDSPSF